MSETNNKTNQEINQNIDNQINHKNKKQKLSDVYTINEINDKVIDKFSVKVIDGFTEKLINGFTGEIIEIKFPFSENKYMRLKMILQN